ncbi:hypothetical protein [Lacunimicrobium album]
MGTSTVRIGNRGFWVIDGLLEVWLRFLSLHVESGDEDNCIEHQIRNQWLFASLGYLNGCVLEGLEEAVSTPRGEQTVRNAINSLMKSLKVAPQKISKDVLNLMWPRNQPGQFDSDLDTWRLIELGQAYLDLLDGKITSAPNKNQLFPGCGPEKPSSSNSPEC